MVKARTRFTTRGAGAGKGRRAAAWTILAGLTVFAVVALSAGFAEAQAPAAAAAAPAPPDLATRVADLEAYITNGTPKALQLAGPGPQRLDDDLVRAGALHDAAGPGAVLRRPRAPKEHPVGHGAVPGLCRPGHHPVVGLRLQLGRSRPARRSSGGLKFAFLKGVTSAPNADYAAWVSQNVFSMYQLMFAIITPALIVGAIAERMKYSAIMAFIALWMLVVYFPLAHMVWGVDGLMNGVWNAKASIKAIDFAGGTVVHMSSGWSALVLCLILGKRTGFGKRAFLPHSMTLTMVGTGMLWVGWYGFNAGSAVAADGIAANAFTTTTLATAVAATVWPLLEWITRGKPTILGLLLGRGRRPGRHHARRRLRVAVERRDHRHPRRRGAVPGLHQAEGDLQVRRRAGYLRRARRRRHHGRASSPASSPRPTSTPT